MAKFGAIPLHSDGREMMGTHGSVSVPGGHILTHVLSGDYVSPGNFIRYTLRRYGTVGVTYAIYAGGFSSTARKVIEYKVTTHHEIIGGNCACGVKNDDARHINFVNPSIRPN